MSGVTLDELRMEVGLNLTQLDKACTNEHNQDIALFLESWRNVAALLGLSRAEVEAAKMNAHSEEERRQKILETWKAKFAFKAKYRVLIEVLLKIGRADEAEKVCRILLPQQPYEGHPICPPEVMKIMPPTLAPSTMDHFSTGFEDVSPPVQAESTPFEHVPVAESLVPATLPAHQLVQAGAKEVSVVRQEKDMLVCMYDKLVANAVETFCEKQDNSPKFFRKLRTSVAVLPSSLKFQHHYFLEQYSSRILKATTVEEIFSILNSYWNFLNCSLLAHIIDKFGDEDLQKELSAYTAALNVFRSRTKITDFIKTCAENSEVPPEFVTLRMRMEPNWENCTLEDAEKYRKSLVEKSSLADHAIYFMGGDTGSIYLLLGVPDHAVCFLAVIMDQQFCNYHGTEEVTINGDGLEEYKHQHHLNNLSEFDVISQHIDEQSEGLVWASGEGCLEDVVFLLCTGVEVNSEGQWKRRTALMLASKGGYLDVVRELLKAHADVNLQDEDGMTALMWASSEGYTDNVAALLSSGAHIDLRDKMNGRSALMLASEGGHVDVVRELLKTQADVNIEDEFGRTALMLASSEGYSDTVHVLCMAGAQVDLQDKWRRRTALMLASVGGHLDVVRELLKAQADVNAQDERDRRTALMLASEGGHLDVVRELLRAQADVNAQDEDGMTALTLASYEGRSETLSLLLSAGALVDLRHEDGWTALMKASFNGHCDAVHVLLSAGAKLDGRTALMLASEGGHVDLVRELLNAQADVDEQDKVGFTALMWASSKAHSETVSILLSAGAQADLQDKLDGRTALMVASVGGHLDVVRELLKAQADVNIQDRCGMTALMWAGFSGHRDIVPVLLSSRAQVDLQDEDGMTALMWASYQGHSETVPLLLSAGVHVDLQDEFGTSALMLASSEGHSDTVSELLYDGAQVDLQNEWDGSTALMLASKGGHMDVVKELLRAHAAVNVQDEFGTTALMLASSEGHSDIVPVLLAARAQVDLQDKHGMTALMWASSECHSDIIPVLLSAGAHIDMQDEDGLTALIYAVRRGNTETVSVLLEAGADVNLQEKASGRSAIFYGAEKGDLEIVKLLIQSEPNLNLKDKDGVTADEVAEVHGHQAVCDELRKHVRVGRRPLSKAVCNRVLVTDRLLGNLYMKKEQARRKGIRDFQGLRQQEDTDLSTSAF